jgi:hypothetical protein
MHPCAAARHPLKGAIPVARQSRFHGISGEGSGFVIYLKENEYGLF